MIRKTVIVVLSLSATVGTLLFFVSFVEVVGWTCFRSQRRHVCIELRDGNVFLHYVYSDHEPFLDTIDEHEADYPKWLGGHQDVSYGESERSWSPEEEAEPGWVPPPNRTYAWSYRYGFPLLVLILLFVPYPTIAFFRGPFRRWRRHRRGSCLKCGYDLHANVSGVCPECGTPVRKASDAN